jgi:type IV pilus assembly protein PilW
MSQQRNLGVTLIELILSMTMSFLIIILLGNIYLVSQKNLAVQAALNSIHENAQFALHFLQAEINNAGFIGCARLTEAFPIINHTNYDFNVNNKIIGAGSTLSIRHASLAVNSLTRNMTDNTTLYLQSDNLHYRAGDILIVSDCRTAEVFQINQIELLDNHSLKMTALTPLNRLYDTTAELRHLEINTFFIKNSPNKDQNGKFIPSIYLQNIKTHQKELIQGVTKLQFTYDVENAGELITVNADQVTDWSKLKAIHIQLDLTANPLNKTWYGYALLH